MRTVRVAVLSDDCLFRDGLQRILSAEPAITVFTLSDSTPTIDDVRAGRPDVLLIDVRMDGAFDLSATLRKSSSGTRTIFVGVNDDDTAIRALASGACGILEKTSTSEQVGKAVQAVARNEIWAPRRVLVAAWLRHVGQSPLPQPLSAVPIGTRLTNREMEVLRYAATGMRNRELAFSLAISESTVKVHLTRIFQKLGVRSRARLAAAYHGIPGPSVASPNVRRPA